MGLLINAILAAFTIKENRLSLYEGITGAWLLAVVATQAVAYTACTFQMAQAMQVDFLFVLPRFFIYVALVAWLVTFLGLCQALGAGLVRLFQAASARAGG